MPHRQTFLQYAMDRKVRVNRGRPLRLPRYPRATPPLSIEREYLRDLRGFLEAIKRNVDRNILTKLPSIISEYDMSRPNMRRDAEPNDSIDSAKIQLFRDFTPEEIRRIAQRKGVETSKFNEAALESGIKRVTGIDIFFNQPYLESELSLFTSQNVRLITSVGEDAFKRIESLIYEGLRTGQSTTEMREEIEAYIDPEGGPVRSRANLIARDQINKLNGQLNGLRQQELGIDGYKWRTLGDERVRGRPDGLYPNAVPSHWDKEGKRFKWDNAPNDTGHPGEDFQCRCFAEPDLSEVVPGIEEL